MFLVMFDAEKEFDAQLSIHSAGSSRSLFVMVSFCAKHPDKSIEDSLKSTYLECAHPESAVEFVVLSITLMFCLSRYNGVALSKMLTYTNEGNAALF